MHHDAPQRPLIFGGSFDPPHRAHVHLPEQARRALHADALFYIPTVRSPHKPHQQLTPIHHRLRMLELALADQPHARILHDEIERAADDQPTYTVDTLAAMRDQLPHASMRLLIGTDQARAFHRWHQPDRIVQLAEPAVMLRAPETRDAFLAHFPPDQRQTWDRRIVHVDPLQISASDIRQRIARNLPINHLVPAAVARYIAEHNLYK